MKMNKFVYVATIACALSMSGCEWGQKKPSVTDNVIPPDLGPSMTKVEDIGESIDDATGRIETIEANVKEETSAIREDVQSTKDGNDQLDSIKDSANTIDDEIDSLRDARADLERQSEKIEEVGGDLEVQEGRIEDSEDRAARLSEDVASLEKELDEAKSENKKLLRNKLNWIIVTSVVGIGICMFLAIFLRSKMALTAAFGLALVMGVSIVASLYLEWIAYVTIGLLAIGGIYLCYLAFKKNKAFDQVVHTGELTKEYLDEDARGHIFGRGPEPGRAHSMQDPYTRKLVNQARRGTGVVNAGSKFTPAWRPNQYNSGDGK